MVLYNGTNRARYVYSLINANQGGGDKKAGTPPEIGRTEKLSMFLVRHPLARYQNNNVNFKMGYISRPSWVSPSNWKPH